MSLTFLVANYRTKHPLLFSLKITFYEIVWAKNFYYLNLVIGCFFGLIFQFSYLLVNLFYLIQGAGFNSNYLYLCWRYFYDQFSVKKHLLTSFTNQAQILNLKLLLAVLYDQNLMMNHYQKFTYLFTYQHSFLPFFLLFNLLLYLIFPL